MPLGEEGSLLLPPPDEMNQRRDETLCYKTKQGKKKPRNTYRRRDIQIGSHRNSLETKKNGNYKIKTKDLQGKKKEKCADKELWDRRRY